MSTPFPQDPDGPIGPFPEPDVDPDMPVPDPDREPDFDPNPDLPGRPDADPLG